MNKKKIMAKVVGDLGIGFFTGGVVSFSFNNQLSVFALALGAIFIVLGAINQN